MPKNITPAVALFAGLASCVLLPGCVVWDIRDNLVKSNQQIGEVKAAIDKANVALDQANQDLANANQRLDNVEQGLTKLDRTNALIDKVDNGLGKIDTTNDALAKLDKQLALLASIDTSLGHLDQHLAAVRKTIGSINSMIPFMDLGGGPEEPAAATAAVAPGAERAAPASGDAPKDQQASPKREWLEGAWIMRVPNNPAGQGGALVFSSDGTYASRTGLPPVGNERGTWTRDNTTLHLKPQQPVLKQETTRPDGTKENKESPPAPYDYTIVYCSQRALVLESNGAILVFGRP